ncbi:MAG: hypothetical protein J6K92_08415, partial [Oscillospiraceae bacterium]|nr:hypothetical protein [Oscillospiraceae bacterium]
GRCEYSCYGDGSAEFTNSGADYTPSVPEEAPVPEETEPMTSADVAVVPGFDDPYNLLGLTE